MSTKIISSILVLIGFSLIATSFLISEEQTSDNQVTVGEIVETQAVAIKKEFKPVLYVSNEKVSLSVRERECLIKNAFHEAGVESIEGKLSVIQVTMNRVKNKRWSSNVCKTVLQKAQFSWTLEKKKLHQKPKGKLWDDSVKAVEKFESGIRVKGLEAAHFYHTDYITQPKWADDKHKVAVVGRHIFYSQDRKL